MKRKVLIRSLAAGLVAASAIAVSTVAGAESSGRQATSTDASADVDPDGRLQFAYTLAAPGGFDPHRANGTFANISLYPVYDRLVHLNTDGSAKPGLAESWEFSEDGLTFTLHLREGVVFHDGEPFDAEAVKANLDRAKNLDGSTVSGELAPVDEVEVVDEFTVALHLSAPAASLPLQLSDKVGMMVSPAAFEDPDALLTQPVGAGAFVVSAFDPDASITFDRFDDYWNPDAVRLAGIDFTVQTDANARLNALLNREIDMTFINANQVGDAEGNGFTVQSEPLLSFQSIIVDRSEAPFDDPEVRKALSHAIDRGGINEALNQGVGSPSIQLYPENYFAWNAEYPYDYYAYDPELAKEMLADAGYPDGFDFTLVVMNVPYVEAWATAVQAQWAEIGVDAQFELIDPAAGAQKCFIDKDCTAFTIRSLSPDPVSNYIRQYSADGLLNLGGDTTPELEELIDQIQAASDPDERAELLQQASAVYVENALDWVVYLDASPLAYNDSVVGAEYYATGWQEFWNVGIAAD